MLLEIVEYAILAAMACGVMAMSCLAERRLP